MISNEYNEHVESYNSTVKHEYVEFYNSNAKLMVPEVRAYIKSNKKSIRKNIILTIYQYLYAIGAVDALNRNKDGENIKISKEITVSEFMDNDSQCMYDEEKWYHPYDESYKYSMMDYVFYKVLCHAVLNFMNKFFKVRLRWKDIEDIYDQCHGFEKVEEILYDDNITLSIGCLEKYNVGKMPLKRLIKKGKKYTVQEDLRKNATEVIRNWYIDEGVCVSHEDIITSWPHDDMQGAVIEAYTTLDTKRFSVFPVTIDRYVLEVRTVTDRKIVSIHFRKPV